MSRGRNGWRTIPAHVQGVRKALSAAVARGDRETAKTLTKRAIELQQKLFGDSGEPDNGGRPFNDDLPF